MGKYNYESYLGGYRLANLSIFPVQYLPSQRKLRLYTYLEFEIYTSFSPYQGIPVYRRSKKVEKIWEDIIKSIVYNPEDLGFKKLDIIIEDFKERGKFSPTELPSIYGSSVECIIIVPDTLFLNAIKEFAEFKIKKGCPTVIKTLKWIYDNYDGFDEQDKIRNFIKDAYSYWGTIFCVLIGDKELIPVRYLMTKRDVFWGPRASDAYYVGLDGNWNTNGDSIFAYDYTERDFTPEVFVGRIVVNNLSELDNFLEKYFSYIKPESLYQNKALLFGSTNLNGCVEPYVQKIKTLLEDHGYLVKDFVDWWPEAQNNNLKPGVINEMNKGAIVFHTYHGGVDKITIDDFPGGSTDFTVGDILSLNNMNKYNILYSYGCGAGDWTHQYSLSHIWLTAHQKGGVAWLGSTQVNFNTDVKYMKKFVEYLLFSKHPHLGIIEWVSKADIPSQYYYIHQLSGDPEMEVWTDIPKKLIVSYPSPIQVGTQPFQVIVWDETLWPVESALVCIYKEDEVYVYDYTDENGEVTFSITPETQGDIYITATKHNYRIFQGIGEVTGTMAPYIRYKTHIIDDDVYGQSNGNSNGIIEANEIIELKITLENTGGFPSTGTYALLSTADPYIRIINPEVFYGTIPPGSQVEGEPFLIKILDMPSNEDRHYALLNLKIIYNGLTSYDDFPVYLYVPDLKHTSHKIEKNRTRYYLYPEVTNYNYGWARDVFAYLSCGNPEVTIIDSIVYFGEVKGRERKEAPQDIFVNRFEFETELPLDIITFKIKYKDYYGEIWEKEFIIKQFSGPQEIKVIHHIENGVKLTWSSIPNIEIKGYDIYRSLNKNGPYERLNYFVIDTIRIYQDINLLPNTYYYYYVVAIDKYGNKAISKDTLYTISYFPYQAGFPKLLSYGQTLSPFPCIIADIDYGKYGDEIITWWNGNLYVLYGNGEYLPGFPQSIGEIALPCICDFDHDLENEIICALRWEPKIRIYEKNGNYIEYNYNESTGAVGISIGDIQNDGKYEIIIVTNNGKLIVMNEQGNVEFKSEEWGGMTTSPAIGDIDGNGFLEIVFSCKKANEPPKVFTYRYSLYPPDPRYELMPGFPVNLPVPIHYNLCGNPIIGNINLVNSEPEIVQFAQIVGSLYICCINKNGEITNSGYIPPLSSPFNCFTTNYPTIGKYKNDTLMLAIAYEKNKKEPKGNFLSLIPFQNTFKILIKDSIMSIPNSPILVNFDDDHETEFLISTFTQNITAIDNTGKKFNGFPIRFGLNPLLINAASIGDLDADGDIEVCVLVDNGEIFVWDTPFEMKSYNEWRYPRHDLYNTGNYHFVVPQYIHTDDKNSTAYNSQKKLLIDNHGNLHLVYHAFDSVFYAYSNNEGINWVFVKVGYGEYPSISINNGINCVWRKDKKIYFRRKLQNWQNEHIILSLPSYSNFVSVPSFIDYNNYGYVLVEIYNNLLGQWQLLYGEFNLNNPSQIIWNIIDRRGPPTPLSFSNPSIDIDDYGKLHLVYEINDTIFYRFKNSEWSAPEVISEGLLNKNPSISYFRNYIDVVWEKDGEIYHRKKPSGGNWWQIENISNTYEESGFPVFIGSSQVLWQERVIAPPNAPYFIAHRSFNGTNWEEIQDVSGIGSYNPQVTLKILPPDSGIIYFVYTKEKDNFYEIKCNKKKVYIPYLLSGEISKSLELKNKIYITGDIIVPDSVNLKIKDAKVYFYPYFDDQKKNNINLSEIIVYGKINSENAEFLPLSNLKGSYGGIRFINSKFSEIKFSKIKYSSYGIEIYDSDSIKVLNSHISENYKGIDIKNSDGILIENSFIEKNKYLKQKNGFLEKELISKRDTNLPDSLTGIYAYNSSLTLKNNRITDNFVGLYANGFLNLYSYGNLIKDNLWHGYDMAVSNSSNLIFEKDSFINNGWYPKIYNLNKKYYIEFAGLSLAHRYYSDTSDIKVINSYFKNNCDGIRIGRYGRYPFYALYDIKVKGCEFDSNFYAISFHGGYVSHINSIFTKNIFKNSDSSNIIIAAPFDSVRLNLGNIENNDTIDDGQNHILGSIYSIIDSSYYDIYAQANLWDFSDSALIDSKIYDNDENPSLSNVNFKYFYKSGIIKKDTTIKGKFFISGDIIVPENVKLKLKPPVDLIFSKKFDILKSGNDKNLSEIIIYGDLKIEGEGKILFTSDGFIKEKGDFYGIIFKKGKEKDSIYNQEICEKDASYFRNTNIEYSYKGIEFLRENKKLKLKNSSISNSNYGIYFNGKDIEIENSNISLNDTGIYLLKGKGYVKETEIKENSIGVIYKGNSEVNIDKSFIIKNKIGIYVDQNSKPKLKNGKNYICYNSEYNLYNNTVFDIEAQRNFWGTENYDTISLLIYDFYDDKTKGKVYFEPIWVPEKEIISGIQGNKENIIDLIKINTISLKNFEVEIILNKSSEISLKIYDVSGRKIKEIKNKLNSGIYKFNINNLKKGVYFIEVEIDKMKKRFKILKI